MIKIVLCKLGKMFVKVGNKIDNYASDYFTPIPGGGQSLLNANIRYKDKHKGKRAFIVANGPSIASQNLALLKNEITYTMSGIWKHPDISTKWNPTYYCVADPVYFEEKAGFESVKDFFKNINNKLKKAEFFMPFFGKKTIEKNNLLPMKKTHYVVFKNGLENTQSMEIDLTKSIPGVQSTAQLAIELAIYMGCDPIYLIGFDHDWLAKRGLDRHFYKGKTLENHPVAHGNLDQRPYIDDLRDLLTLWTGYQKILKIAKRSDIEIYNATDGGFLDVFARVDYNTIVKLKKYK